MGSMNSSTRQHLVKAVVSASHTVLAKSASADVHQREVLEAAWPHPEEGLSKRASLARVLATGLMVEEAEQALAQG